MLLALTVKDVATIESCSLEFGPGLTVLTGETGAGKSLLADAIGLALGDRADSELVRSGARKAVVSLSVDVSKCPAAVRLCAENGIDEEDGEIVIVRELSAEGRSTVRINGRLASVGVLRQIGAELVDMHGQHDHQVLLDVERQIAFLDEWAENGDLVAEVGRLFADVEGLRRRLASLRADRRDIEQRTDILRFQVDEIESVRPVPGEFEELEARITRLRHAEKLVATVNEAQDALSEGEGAALERISGSVRSLESLSALDQGVEQVLDPLRDSLFSLEEALRQLRAYADSLDLDPNALEEAATRLDSLKRLRKKYGEDEAAVLAYLDKAKDELALLEQSGTSEDELASALERAEQELRKQADELTRIRTRAAKQFAEQVTKHARELAMEKAEFEVRISPKPVQVDGADAVEFYFTANPGDPPKPMAKVASGGEISRIMLAIKAASAGRAGVPTLVFDEVDSGLGGRAAAVTAGKLQQLARHNQVLVVSHLPQIAGRADTHFRIEKGEKQGRSSTEVVELHGEERILEVARMLAGEKVGDSALANARELIG